MYDRNPKWLGRSSGISAICMQPIWLHIQVLTKEGTTGQLDGISCILQGTALRGEAEIG